MLLLDWNRTLMYLSLLVGASLLLLACSGNGEKSPEVASTPAAGSPGSATPEQPTARLIPDPLPVKPIIFEPLPQDSAPRLPIIYDTLSGTSLDPGTVAYRAAWSAIDPRPAAHFGEGRIAVYDHANSQWRALKDFDRPNLGPASNDGSKLAVSVPGRLIILDFASSTLQEYPIEARPVAWSPDDRRLAVTVRSSDPLQSPHIVFPIASPASALRLPLGKSPNSIAQNPPVWLSSTRILMVSQNVHLLQIVDIAGGFPRLILEESVPSDQVALSPDKAMLAVQDSTAAPGRVKIYRLDPFARLKTLDDASLGYQLLVPSEIWSRDNSKLLAHSGPCGNSQRLMLFDLAATARREIAVGRVMRFVLSPNAEWVAYTFFGKLGYVVPVDRSTPARLVSDDVAAPMEPRWSLDSRYVAFSAFFGGYDHCD